MKLTDKQYSNQVFKRTSFCNEGIAVWWTKKKFERCQFLGCDFSDVLARGRVYRTLLIGVRLLSVGMHVRVEPNAPSGSLWETLLRIRITGRIA